MVTDRTQVKLKLSPGRPGVRTRYEYKWEFRHRLEWSVNEQAVESAAKTDGLFPLITNTSLEAADVLVAYKRQPFLKKRIYTKKSILEVAPVYLKKTHRIEAIMLLYFVALMIITLMERSIRAKMAKEKIEKLPILPQGMNTRRPTWDNIRYFFRNVHLSEIIRGAVSIQTEVMGVTAMHAEILRLLGVPGSAYDCLQQVGGGGQARRILITSPKFEHTLALQNESAGLGFHMVEPHHRFRLLSLSAHPTRRNLKSPVLQGRP